MQHSRIVHLAVAVWCCTPLTAFSAPPVDLDVALSSVAVVNDNFYSRDINSQNVTGAIVTPTIRLLRAGAQFNNSLLLSASGGAFNSSSEDSFLDYLASANSLWRGGYQSVEVNAAYQRGHDPFGEVRTEGDDSENRQLDLWTEARGRLKWRRDGQIRGSAFTEVDLSFFERNYTTNEEITAFLNREGYTAGAIIGLNLTAKTGVFTNLTYSALDFENEVGQFLRSGDTTAGLLGVRWQATARTSGDVRLGYAERSDDSGFSLEASYWSAEITIQPTATDSVRVATNRTFDASYFSGTAFFDSMNHQLYWERNWNERFVVTLGGEFREREFIRSGTSDGDDLLLAQFRAEYTLDRGFSVFGRVRYVEREATADTRDFDASLVELGFDVSLN